MSILHLFYSNHLLLQIPFEEHPYLKIPILMLVFPILALKAMTIPFVRITYRHGMLFTVNIIMKSPPLWISHNRL
jgi:hypothetical protein